jgi:hypothetical protein
LLSVCLGADSTAVAWSKHPEEFSEIQAMVMLQPVSGRYIVEEFVKGIGLDDGYEKFDKAVHERTGFHLSDAGRPGARRHDDATRGRPGDLRRDSGRRKSLYWIEGTDRRFDGYNFFGVHPELPIEWFDKHIN